jgi:hypothetical protein
LSVTINDTRAGYTFLWIFTIFLLILKSSSTLTLLFFCVPWLAFTCFFLLFYVGLSSSRVVGEKIVSNL